MASARTARQAPAPARHERPRPRPQAVRGPVGGTVIRWDRVGRFVIGCIFIAVFALYIRPLWSVFSTRGEAAKRSAEVSRLAGEQRALDARIKALRDPSALESEARSLGMVRPGERAYVINGLRDTQK
ncbi:unannotated protein [freshwater metagenome]|uniref:Unannotated protein n=1 Tax=freshwater metagenome TaxID=449393 RepID=A0A6J7ITU2_9ZZZZ|nr:hypothetical protein [Actinomycetota bacterium]